MRTLVPWLRAALVAFLAALICFLVLFGGGCSVDGSEPGPSRAAHCNRIAHERTGFFDYELYERCLRGHAQPGDAGDD